MRFGIEDPPEPAAFLYGLSETGTERRNSFNVLQLPAEIPLEINHPGRVATVEVSADVNNSWAFIGVSLTDPEDEPVFETGRTVERYSGRDADGSWSEGRRSSTVRFIPSLQGTYTLEIDVEEADTWQRLGLAVKTVTVQTRKGLVSGFWMFWVTSGFVLFALYHHARAFKHEFRRMRSSGWSDGE